MDNTKLLEEAQRALGSFLWLKNNMHNYGTSDFKAFLLAAMEDAKEAYDKLEKETNHE